MPKVILTIACLMLVTCECPLGERGQYGTVGVYYKAPVDWMAGPKFLPDKL